MIEDPEEKPVTLSQLKAVLAEFRVDFKLELKDDMAALLARFDAQILEPRFKAIDDRFNRVDVKLDDHDQRFDDLYKKFEDLHHEYLIANDQMREIRAEIVRKLSH
jgi:hypothetical protein